MFQLGSAFLQWKSIILYFVFQNEKEQVFLYFYAYLGVNRSTTVRDLL